MSDLPDWMATMHRRAVNSPVQTAIAAPAIPYRNAPRNRPPPRQMRPAEQRAMDPNAGVRRQAMGEIQRRNTADLATMPRTPRGNQFAEAGSMALEATGLPQVRRGAETLGDVAQAPYAPNAPMRALGGLGELGLGVLGAATFGEVGAMRPRVAPAPRSPANLNRFDDIVRERPWPIQSANEGVPDDFFMPPAQAAPQQRSLLTQRRRDSFEVVPPEPMPRMTPPPRANLYLDYLREQGFDVDTPLYHGTLRDFDQFTPSENSVYGPSGRGVYLTNSTEEASLYAGDPKYRPLQYRLAEGGNVRPVFVRGQFIEPLADAEGRMLPIPENVAGYRLQTGENTEYIVRDPRDIAYRFGQVEPPPRITRPPREIAPNGMTIRPPEPFRNSLRGGSDDLAEAAGMRAPDVGNAGGRNAYLDDLRAQGFDVDATYYHGTASDFDTFRPGRPFSITQDIETANTYSGKNSVDGLTGANVRPMHVRGRIVSDWTKESEEVRAALVRAIQSDGADRAAIDELNRLGVAGYHAKGMPGAERVIFDPDNVRPRFGPAPNAPARSPNGPKPSDGKFFGRRT